MQIICYMIVIRDNNAAQFINREYLYILLRLRNHIISQPIQSTPTKSGSTGPQTTSTTESFAAQQASTTPPEIPGQPVSGLSTISSALQAPPTSEILLNLQDGEDTGDSVSEPNNPARNKYTDPKANNTRRRRSVEFVEDSSNAFSVPLSYKSSVMIVSELYEGDQGYVPIVGASVKTRVVSTDNSEQITVVQLKDDGLGKYIYFLYFLCTIFRFNKI